MKLHAPTWLVIVLLMSVTISTSVKARGHLGRGKRAVTVTLTLQPRVNVVGHMSRENGHPESLGVRDNRFQFTLPGGTGELPRFGDANFPGLND